MEAAKVFGPFMQMEIRPEDFPPAARAWLASAIAGMVCADGVVHKEELKYLERAIALLENKRDAVLNLMSQVQVRAPAPLEQYWERDRNVALKMIMALTAVAVSDFSLAEAEEKFLRSAAHCLGFDNKFCNELIVWAKEIEAFKNMEIHYREKIASQEDGLKRRALTTAPVY